MARKLTSFSKFLIIAFIIMSTGWVQSIFKFAKSDFSPINKREVVYGIGTFVPPVGCIVG